MLRVAHLSLFKEKANREKQNIRYSHIFSNDSQTGSSVKTIEALQFSDNEKKYPQVAIFVGTGNMLSYLHTLLNKGIAKIYILDLDDFVLDWVEETLKLLKESHSIKDFKTSLLDIEKNKLLNKLISAYQADGFTEEKAKQTISARFEEETGEAYPHHFCNKALAFDQTKSAIERVDIELIQINLFSQADVLNFQQRLSDKNEQICYANFTNVGMWAIRLDMIESYMNNLKRLPWNQTHIIQAATGSQFTVLSVNNLDSYANILGSHEEKKTSFPCSKPGI